MATRSGFLGSKLDTVVREETVIRRIGTADAIATVRPSEPRAIAFLPLATPLGSARRERQDHGGVIFIALSLATV